MSHYGLVSSIDGFELIRIGVECPSTLLDGDVRGVLTLARALDLPLE